MIPSYDENDDRKNRTVVLKPVSTIQGEILKVLKSLFQDMKVGNAHKTEKGLLPALGNSASIDSKEIFSAAKGN